MTTLTRPNPARVKAGPAFSFLWLEITGRCGLSCSHCYAGSGPAGSHGAMTADDWRSVITQAAGLGVSMVQFIGGEPTLHPDFAALLGHAVGAGLAAEVYSNLTHVRDSWWELFACPKVSLATSYYSDDPAEHDAITGRPGSHARTLANIGQAVSRGIPVRAGIIEVADGQRTGPARAELEALGVRRIRTDRVRRLGRAASAGPDVSQLCGNCGRGIAAILPSGDVCPCVMARLRRPLVTQVGTTHADHAAPGTRCDGWATSSATLPALAIDMYRHARIYNGADVLDVGTGSGDGAALLTRRLGAEHVTSIDVDPYLTATATERLASFAVHPRLVTADATGDLPGECDRIVPMVSMPAIPASWLTALRPGGRLVFALTGGSVLITADKTPDGGARGRVEYDRASFMTARHGPGYPPRLGIPEHVRQDDGEHVTTSPYPVVDPEWGWELDAILSVTDPGITIRSHTDDQTGITTTWMTHDDGSWARATGKDDELALVHQSGPRRLWDLVDDYRRYWLTHGCLPLRGARAGIEPDGICHLSQGKWRATIPAATIPAATRPDQAAITPDADRGVRPWAGGMSR